MNHDERGLPGRWNAPGRRTRCGVVAVVLAAILAGGILASGPAAAAPTIPDGGIRVKPGPPGDVCAEVRLAAQAGFPYVSFGSGWEGLEPSPGDYRDPATERAILSCAKGLGLKTFLVLTGAPEWASGRAGVVNDPPTPANVPAYGAFLSQLAGRLGPLVDVWAVWNEPNLDLFWAPPHDAGRYVQIQQTGYAAIKGADPTSLVATAPIVGASSGSQTSAWDYIEAAYRAGLKGSADLILMNYYPRGAPEGTATDSRGRPAPYSLSSQPYLRSLVNRFDPGRPLWITETSYSTCNCNDIPGNQVSESQQADYLVRVFLYRRRYLDGVTSRIFWYELRDKGPNRSDWFANQGIVRNDFSLKPAFAALSAIQSDEAPAGGGGGGTPFTLPRAALRPPAPSSRVTARGIRLRLGKPRVVLRRGRITLAVRAGISAGRGVLRVQGFRRNSWRRIAVVRLRRSAIVRVRFRDKGYLGVRVLLTTPGQGVRSGVARVVRLGPAPPG